MTAWPGPEDPPPTEQTTSVLVVAPALLHREALALLLARHPRLRVLGTACGDAVAALVEELAPDLVLVDVAGAAPAAVRSIVPAAARAKVVALGPADDDRLIVACAEAGVSGYADVDGTLDELAEVIASVGLGQFVCSPALASRLLRQVGVLARRATPVPAAELTSRELEIMALVDEGLSNKQIAARLHIQVATVKNHVHNILEKLHVSGRAAAAARTRGARRLPANGVDLKRS
jgi:two-component system, NarL family, nitrate/nitrite response regulator NarL